MLKKLSAVPLLACIVLFTPLQAVAQQTQPPNTSPASPEWYWRSGPWHMGGDGYGGQFWWMGPTMMLFIIFICVAVLYILFARHPGSGMSHQWGPPPYMAHRTWNPPTHSALQILNERFARGEIQKDEYEDKKAAILSGGEH